MIVPAVFGCQNSGKNPDGGSGGAGRSGGMTGGPASSGGDRNGGSTGNAGSSGGGGSSGGSTGTRTAGGSTISSGGSTTTTSTCYVDFPCQYTYRCTADGYQPYETNYDCHSVCGPGPCSGASCDPSGSPVACPAGTRCLELGSSDITQACRPIDAGVADSGSIDTAVPDAGSMDAGASDLVLKKPADAPICDPGATACQGKTPLICDATGAWKAAKPCANACSNGVCVGDCSPGTYQCQGSAIQSCDQGGLWETVATCSDTCSKGLCVESCTAGEQRCKDLEAQTCSSAGLWQDGRACLYSCSAGACTGECTPGNRRCRENTAQTCSSAAVWVDQQACTGNGPVCAGGQCVASCLAAGQDCTDPQTSCCQGTECMSADGGKTSTCRAVSCTALGNACAATTDCCAGLDCTGGRCVARSEACLEEPEDGVCAGTSAVTCCPGTVCGTVIGSSSLGCAIPSSTQPQDVTCPRDKPSQHDPCSAARFGLECTYSDWVKEPGVFYTCTCNYHGWSCVQGHYV